jgi:hypothetical protein
MKLGLGSLTSISGGSRSHNINRLNWHIRTLLDSNEVSFSIKLAALFQRVDFLGQRLR